MARDQIKPTIPAYSFLSIRGAIFANTFNNNYFSVSFGCPESRSSGGVNPNEASCSFA